MKDGRMMKRAPGPVACNLGKSEREGGSLFEHDGSTLIGGEKSKAGENLLFLLFLLPHVPSSLFM
jgi:hypothetical protein